MKRSKVVTLRRSLTSGDTRTAGADERSEPIDGQPAVSRRHGRPRQRHHGVRRGAAGERIHRPHEPVHPAGATRHQYRTTQNAAPWSSVQRAETP
ncbi:hypothetical protein ACFPM0_33175 [Pseudonocardia sulfidoxydans]|uniref:hypothetical protein n=1 Tax=Pseudonocardia sulfidoxydans TaxID=54011 RepID=UPI00360A1461